MPVARLFVVTVLLCSPLAFAQNTQKPPENDISKPWSIVRPPQDSAQDLAVRANHYKADYFQFDACGRIVNPYTHWPSGHLSEGQLADKSCYNLLSFPMKAGNTDPADQDHPDSLALMAKASRLVAEAEVEPDTICYSIRNYRVARDSPDSDSTHPVGTSTCQRASRYQVRTVQIEQTSPNR
jgi:hypothetical protein